MKIIGIGETVYDIIFKGNQPLRAVPGGSTFNAIISLGRTRRQLDGVSDILFISETGDDHVGRMIIDFLHDSNVSSEFVAVHKGTKSHISLAFLDENNDAHYTFYKDHQSADIPDFFPQVSAGDLVLFGSFFAINPVLRPRTRRFLNMAHDAGAILYYDINFRRPHLADLNETMPNITENYALATVVRGSTDDFDILYGTRDIDEIYHRFVAPRCKNLIITNGKNPVTVFTENACRTFTTEPLADVVSTIGAGDNFNAGVLFSLAKQTGISDFGTSLFASIPTAQHFSQAVCRSLHNYVDKNFIV